MRKEITLSSLSLPSVLIIFLSQFNEKRCDDLGIFIANEN